MFLPPSLTAYIKLLEEGQNAAEDSEVSRKTLCYTLKDTIILMCATELAWAVSTILFRFILVKYAERGLVSGGVVSKLFDHLYICFATFLTVLMYSLILVGNLREEPVFIKICLSHSGKRNIESWKNYSIGISLFCIGIISLMLMYWSSYKYLKSRSKDGRTPPSIFGRFQRNVLTFTESMYYHTLILVVILIFTVLNYWSNSIYFCIIPICTTFLFSCYILLASMIKPTFHRPKPNVAPQDQIFYVRDPQIIPRRDHLVPHIPIPGQNMNIQPVPIPANIIHVQPVNNELEEPIVSPSQNVNVQPVPIPDKIIHVQPINNDDL